MREPRVLRRATLTHGAVAVLEEMRNEPWPPNLKPVRILTPEGEQTDLFALHLVSEAYDQLAAGVRAGQFPTLSDAIIATYIEGPDHEAGEAK